MTNKIKAMVVLVALMTACAPSAAIRQAQKEIVLLSGHQRIAKATGDNAHLKLAIAQKVAWETQLYNLDGTKLSNTTVTILKLKGLLPEGYEE